MASRRKKTPTGPSNGAERTTKPGRKPKINTEQPEVAAATTDLRARLREDIINCVLKPGQRLKFEELRSRYDAGIGNLREVLLQLEADGLVVTEANRGFCVAPVSIADLEDVTELTIDIEKKALTQSILHGDDAWEASIVAALHMLIKLDTEALQNPVRSRAAWDERHRHFHDALFAACPSPWLKRFRRVLWDQSQRYATLSMTESQVPSRVVQEHRKITEAVVGRKVPDALSLMEQHVRDTLDYVRDWLTVQGSHMAETDFSRNDHSDAKAVSTRKAG